MRPDGYVSSDLRPSAPVINVLMAAYNSGPYVVEAVESLLRQTFANIEIIVVNDGSTDGTLKHLESAAARDGRVRVINLEQNHGSVAARNLGLGFCRAPFIAVMDHDDVAVPFRLEKQLEFLRRHPDIAVVGGGARSIDAEGNPINLMGSSPLPVTQAAIRKTLLLGPPCFHRWLARREVYEALSGYRELFPTDDYDFLLRAVSSGFKIANVPDVLMETRIRSAQASNRFALQQRKIHHYVISLHKERLRSGGDSFTAEHLAKAVSAGALTQILHRTSMHCVDRGFSCKGRWKKAFFLATAALISPLQARYFFDRVRSRRICSSVLNQGT